MDALSQLSYGPKNSGVFTRKGEDPGGISTGCTLPRLEWRRYRVAGLHPPRFRGSYALTLSACCGCGTGAANRAHRYA
jgi:hypothetical protein